MVKMHVFMSLNMNLTTKYNKGIIRNQKIGMDYEKMSA